MMFPRPCGRGSRLMPNVQSVYRKLKKIQWSCEWESELVCCDLSPKRECTDI